MDSTKIEQLASALTELLKNEDFHNAALPKPNFWDIIHYGESSYENRYNRMFAWLLDPTANHGLGASVINGLLDQIATGSVHLGTRKVRTETETAVPAAANEANGSHLKGRIDITVNDPINQVYVAFECKMKSSQHTEQLGRYRSWVQNKYQDYSARYFIFLTEEAETPLDEHPNSSPQETWVNVTFEDLQSVITLAVQEAGGACSDSAQFIIEQFLADQKRRTAVSVSEAVEDLFSENSSTAQAGVLLTAIEALEIEDARVRAYSQAKRVHSMAAPEDSRHVHEELASSFEALGGSSTDLDRVLSTCWEHRPPMVDMSKNEETIKIIKEVAEAIAGKPVEPKQEVAADGYPRFFKSVKISSGRQNITLNLHDGMTIYFAGSNKNVVPSVLHHWGKDSAGDHPGSGCVLAGKDVRGKLASAHGGSGAKLADDFVAFLTQQQESGDLSCKCGRHMTGLVER